MIFPADAQKLLKNDAFLQPGFQVEDFVQVLSNLDV
jgi:hypothetical protein